VIGNPQSPIPNPQSHDSLVGSLMDPSRAGRLQARVTKYENDPFVVDIEGKIRCTCGCNLSVYTCRTTDFTCTTSPAMHQRVIELVEQGKSAPQILDAFVAQYGESVLMAPPREGFNILGYVVPGILITLVGGTLAWIMVRKTRVRLAEAGGARAAEPDSSLPPDQAAKLRAEMEKLEL
jgi:cytochrome c-type biogenesis protein CcmH